MGFADENEDYEEAYEARRDAEDAYEEAMRDAEAEEAYDRWKETELEQLQAEVEQLPEGLTTVDELIARKSRDEKSYFYKREETVLRVIYDTAWDICFYNKDIRYVPVLEVCQKYQLAKDA